MTITFTHKDNYGSALKSYVYKRDERTMDVSHFLLSHWGEQRKKVILADLCELLAEKGILNVDDIKRLAYLPESEPHSYEEQQDHRLNDGVETSAGKPVSSTKGNCE